LEEAIAKYNLAIDLDPSNSVAHLLLGRALVGQGRLGKAIDTFRRSLAVDPHFFHAQYEISNVLLRQGKVDEAIDAAHKALEIFPDSPGAYRSLCLALHAKGRLNEATDACRRGLDLLHYQGWMDSIADNFVAESENHPTDPSTHLAVGVVMLENGQLDEAIDAFHKVLELELNHGLALYYLGNALRQQGKLEEAIRAYRRAIQIDATYAHAHRDLGVALMAQNDPQAARKALQKSMDLSDGGDARDWFWVAMSEWQLGNEQEAHRWYKQAVRWMDENDPENRRLVAARAEAEKTLGLTEGGQRTR
jgi:superkiller protein 3